jgi:hypothetical protein
LTIFVGLVLVFCVGLLPCLSHSTGCTAYRSPNGRVNDPDGNAELGVSRPPLGDSGNRLVKGISGSGIPPPYDTGTSL